MKQIYFPGLEPQRPQKTVIQPQEQSVEELEGMKVGQRFDPLGCVSDNTYKKTSVSENKKNDTQRDYTIPIIRVICCIVGLLATLMSWYYSLEWFKDKLPGAWKYILPVIIVGCSVLLPEVFILLFKRKGVKNKSVAFIVLITGLIASAFSMASTIAGIYNANSQAIMTKSKSIILASSYDDAKKELDRIDKELERINHEIDSTQSKVDNIATDKTLSADSQTLMRRLGNAKIQKSIYEQDRQKVFQTVEQIRREGLSSEVVREDFNAFISRITGISAQKVEFIMSAAPGLLLDVIAPLMAGIALFL